MKPIRRQRFLVCAIIAALPAFAAAASAQSPAPNAAPSPFVTAVTPGELTSLRGGSSVNSLPAIRLWDEISGRGQTRHAVPGAVSVNGGTLTIRVGGR